MDVLPTIGVIVAALASAAVLLLVRRLVLGPGRGRVRCMLAAPLERWNEPPATARRRPLQFRAFASRTHWSVTREERGSAEKHSL